MKAYLKNYRQAPRKVRLLADFVRGKDVTKAISELTHVNKRASFPIKKLIESAAANAKEKGISQDQLLIKEVQVDKGITFKRFRARARGRGAPIHKHSSHVRIVLGEKPVEKVKEEVKEEAPKKVENKVKKSTANPTAKKK